MKTTIDCEEIFVLQNEINERVRSSFHAFGEGFIGGLSVTFSEFTKHSYESENMLKKYSCSYDTEEILELRKDLKLRYLVANRACDLEEYEQIYAQIKEEAREKKDDCKKRLQLVKED